MQVEMGEPRGVVLVCWIPNYRSEQYSYTGQMGSQWKTSGKHMDDVRLGRKEKVHYPDQFTVRGLEGGPMHKSWIMALIAKEER